LANLGAGDQGLVYGYACRETPELMPLPIVLSHRLCERLAEVRHKNIIRGLRPDGKSQVTVEYEDSKPKRIDTVLIAAQHEPDKKLPVLKKEIASLVIKPVLKSYGYKIDAKTKVLINTTGRFTIGGPQGDTGLTGRKIIVDTYGGASRHGGGCFSGKDPSKVDRSGGYCARWVAKNVVAAGLADRCEIQIAYAIGMSEPLSLSVNTFSTGKITDSEIAEKIKKVFDLRPGMIIRELNLRRPIYRQVAAYGHFGRDELDLPWEKTNRIKDLIS
jgi:S-adenosylmethionine synthetase